MFRHSIRASAILLFLSACSGPSGSPLDHLSLSAAQAHIQPGQTDQMKATAWYEDGSHEDVTQSAAYAISNPYSLSVSDSGAAMGLSPGDGVVTATYMDKVSQVYLTVDPAEALPRPCIEPCAP